MKRNPGVIFMLVAIAGCTSQNIDTKAEGEKLMQISREWSKAAVARNIEKTLSYWSDSAVVIAAGEAPLKGKKAIRDMVDGSLRNRGFTISWEPKSAEISKSGDMGYLLEDTKISKMDPSGNLVTKNYKGVTIWKKQADGSWKADVDILSPETP